MPTHGILKLNITMKHLEMTKLKVMMCLISIIMMSAISCTGKKDMTETKPQTTIAKQDSLLKGKRLINQTSLVDVSQPITQFVRRIFEDSRGHLWMGTNGDGVMRYNGKDLEYFGPSENFNAVAVRTILEDKYGTMWFGTENGIIKCDGKSFTSITTAQGLLHNDIWSMTLDNNGLLWIGTYDGVCTYDGTSFKPFKIPDATPDKSRGVSSARIVHSIMQDRAGDMWFGTNGGAYRYDGKTLTNVSTKDGLCGDNINHILEDRAGNMWFATTHNGICLYDGKAFKEVAVNNPKNLEEIEVWNIYEDGNGAIWFAVKQLGLVKYNDGMVTTYSEDDGLSSNAIQSMFEDSKGQFWVGGYKGLSKLKDGRFTHVGAFGPW